MLDYALVEKKMHLLDGYMDEMRPFADGFSADEILGDSFKYHTLERLFQLVVDTMIDINRHIIKEKHLGAPDDLESTFKLLGEAHMLTDAFAAKIAPIVGVRNMIVHRYEKLDRNIFVRNVQKNFGDFANYVKQISQFLEKERAA